MQLVKGTELLLMDAGAPESQAVPSPPPSSSSATIAIAMQTPEPKPQQTKIRAAELTQPAIGCLCLGVISMEGSSPALDAESWLTQLLHGSGCERHSYTSDVTRTWPVSGKFSPEQRAVYEIVAEIYRLAISNN